MIAQKTCQGIFWHACFLYYHYLMHLPLTFSGVVCILSLQGRQEQCPFTTRLRGLKLTRILSDEAQEFLKTSLGNIKHCSRSCSYTDTHCKL